MPKRRVTVKELSGVLGVTSHAMIERCRKEGWSIQNSISKLSPAQEVLVRHWFNEKNRQNTANAEPL